jgi:hypothetical protein
VGLHEAINYDDLKGMDNSAVKVKRTRMSRRDQMDIDHCRLQVRKMERTSSNSN